MEVINMEIPVRKVKLERLEEFVIETQRFLGKICSGKELTILSVGIKEAINNVYDHSNANDGAYIFCQYLTENNSIKIYVSDNGVGIPAKVRELKPNLLDNEFIKWATERRNTTKSTLQNAGYGLSNIVDFVKSNGGSLQIFSGKGKYEIHNGKEKSTNNELKEIVGTQIEFEILIENLEDAEIIETQFF